MYRYSLLGLFSLLLPFTALAQDAPRWVPIGTNSQNMTVFYDTSFLSKNINFTNVRTLERLNAPGADGETQKVLIYRFVCDRKLGTIETIAKFDSRGEIVGYIPNEEIEKLVPVKENSLSEAVYKRACPAN